MLYVLAPNEGWIVDRLVQEWYQENPMITTTNIKQADIVWLMADWCYDRIVGSLTSKKVLTTIHHIVPEKFTPQERWKFQLRDDVTTAYHVPNEHTKEFIQTLTNKLIHVIPYWANQKIWQKTHSREEARKALNLPQDSYLIGSFQRDSEGGNTSLPKLEKGPDLLADAIIRYRDKCKQYFEVEVVLAGWRRQYIISRLNDAGIKHHYFELPDQETLNTLYQALDLYPVTARYEGGPQSFIECGLLNIPMVSRNVGMATNVLNPTSINDDVTLATPQVPNVEHLLIPHGMEPYRKLLASL